MRLGRHWLHCFFVVTCLMALALPVAADDVGVTLARLLELEDGSYALETDVPPRLIGALRPPVAPERFTVMERPSYRQAGVSLVVRYKFGGSDTPLGADDVLLLPWQRSAVLLTARWRDGEVHRALLPRGPAGIRVPIEMLKPIERTAVEVASRHLGFGLTWDAWTLLRLLLVLGIVTAVQGKRSVQLAFIFAAGHGLAMLARDLGVPGLPQVLAVGGLGLGAVLLARSALRDDGARLWPLVLMIGLIDGFGLVAGLEGEGLRANEIIPALFGAVLVIDALQITLVATLTVLWRVIQPLWFARVLNVALGCIAIAVIIAQSASMSRAESRYGNDTASRMAAARFDFRSGSIGGARAAAPPRRLDHAAMAFLTVEPNEVRVEVLLRLLDFIELLSIEGDADSVVPVELQETIAARARQMIADTVEVVIDGREAVPILDRTDFVTVAATGITTGTEPQAEPLNSAVLGVTLVFSTALAPSEIDMNWQAFPTSQTVIPVVWTDPTGSERVELTVEQPTLNWTNDLSSYTPPPARAIDVRPPRWPIVSVALIGLVGLAWIGPLRWHQHGAAFASVLLTAAMVLYPFLRSPVTLPWLGGWKPASAEIAEVVTDLLTNVYRAFDLRSESAVYDRLAVGVTGSQLSDVYLKSRRALELENRGGARARVDEVEILEVHSVQRGEEGGFQVAAAWTVSGSVNHFGHVHYRRNRYDAVLHLLAVKGVWKIGKIDILDERRIL